MEVGVVFLLRKKEAWGVVEEFEDDGAVDEDQWWGEGLAIKYGYGDDVIHGGEEGEVWLRLVIRVSFFLSSLDFFSLKTSSFSPTLEILAQLNNYGNNTLYNYYFWTVYIAKRVKLELRCPLFSSLLN